VIFTISRVMKKIIVINIMKPVQTVEMRYLLRWD
jgi:hypothetical protein